MHDRRIGWRRWLAMICTALLLAGAGSAVARTPPHAAPARTADAAALGLVPDAHGDATRALADAIAHCARHGIHTLRLRPGEYHFHAENAQAVAYAISNTTNTEPTHRIAIRIAGLHGFTLDGSGARFVFHGNLTPIAIDGASDVALRNLSIDWARPFVSQGVLTAVDDHGVELMLDADRYPYAIRDGKLWFTGEGWSYRPGVYVFVDAQANILPGTLDEPLGEDFFRGDVTEIARGRLRVTGAMPIRPAVGTRVVVRHGRGDDVGIFVFRSRRVMLRDVVIYHAPGKALLAQRSEDITVEGGGTAMNATEGRWFSSYADALHFSGCKGRIVVRHVRNDGQMDDWFNVHGTYTSIDALENRKTLVGRFHHKESRNMPIFGEGDAIALLDPVSGAAKAHAVVERMELLPPDRYRLHLKTPLPRAVVVDDIVENTTWTPSVLLEGNTITKTNRARGLLVTTPKPVVIRGNHFMSAGTPILIEGDFHYWFESGAVRDITIVDNDFDMTFTSGVAKAKTVAVDDDGYWWGDASVVAITPTLAQARARMTETTAASTAAATIFHRGIRILRNRIRVPRAPLVYAYAVDGLQFEGNRVEFVDDAGWPAALTSLLSNQPAFRFLSSHGVVIRGNTFVDAPSPRIDYSDMPADGIDAQTGMVLHAMK